MAFPFRTCKKQTEVGAFGPCEWRRGVVFITAAQLYSIKPELTFYTGSNPARGVSEIRDGEDL